MAHIVIILHDLRGGGAEKMMVRLANELVNSGDTVSLVLLTGGGANKQHLSHLVNLYELNCARTFTAFMPLRRILKSLSADAYLSALTHVNVMSFLAALSIGKLKQLSVSERNAFSLDKTVNKSLVMRLTYFFAPISYRLMPRPVIAVSQGVADDLSEQPFVRASDIVIASNPVITKEMGMLAEKPAEHPWLVNKDKKVIVSVGRLSYQKGFDMLIEAFVGVRNKIDCCLVIFGVGELRQELLEQVERYRLSDYVSFAGYSENIIAELKSADLYVLSSRFEGSPNAIVEAMSVGTSVVAFDCPHGAREILHDGKIPYLVDNADIQHLEKAMFEALCNTMDDEKLLKGAVERFKASNSALEYKRLLLK